MSEEEGLNPSEKNQIQRFQKVDERFLKFLNNLYSDEISRFEQSKTFAFPFFIEEENLRKIDEVVTELLTKLPCENEIQFESETGFTDLTTLKLRDFDEFVSKAGDRKDPRFSSLRWTQFSVQNDGNVVSGQFVIEFVTEKRLETQDLPPGEYNRAFITIYVGGSDLDWVESSVNHISPYIEVTKQSGIYRPLWLFRNKIYINILSQVLGWMSFFIGLNQSSRFFNKENIVSREDMLNQIINSKDILEKFDLYATQILSPSVNPWWEPIVIFGVGAISYVLISFSGMTLLPKLTPNSYLAIGLTNYRAKKYTNAFKFIIFTLIVSGILLPILKTFFGL